MRLHEKYNIPKEDLDTVFSENQLRESLEIASRHSLQDWPPVDFCKRQLVFFSNLLSFWYYLLSDIENTKRFAVSVSSHLKEYFLGKWREELPVNRKKSGLWMDEYRVTLMWASCLGQWKEICEVSAYPDEKCLKPGVPGNEELVYYLVLASVIRGESWESLEKYRKQIETGKKKREKLLLKVLEQIVQRNVEGFHKELQPYLKYYKKYEFPKDHTEKLAIDATFLINYARHCGMDVGYPPDYEDHIVKLNQ